MKLHTEADSTTAAASKELARPRVWQDLQILVLWLCWSLMTVRLTRRTT